MNGFVVLDEIVDMTRVEMLIVAFLRETSPKKTSLWIPLSQSEFCARFGIHPANQSRALRSLTKKGFVCVKREGQPPRRFVRLVERGHEKPIKRARSPRKS